MWRDEPSGKGIGEVKEKSAWLAKDVEDTSCENIVNISLNSYNFTISK